MPPETIQFEIYLNKNPASGHSHEDRRSFDNNHQQSILLPRECYHCAASLCILFVVGRQGVWPLAWPIVGWVSHGSWKMDSYDMSSNKSLKLALIRDRL